MRGDGGDVALTIGFGGGGTGAQARYPCSLLHPRALEPGTYLESKGAGAGSSSAGDRGSGKKSRVTLLPGYIRRDRLNVAEAPLTGLTGVHSRAAAGPARVRVSSPQGRKVLFKGARPAAQAWHLVPAGRAGHPRPPGRVLLGAVLAMRARACGRGERRRRWRMLLVTATCLRSVARDSLRVASRVLLAPLAGARPSALQHSGAAVWCRLDSWAGQGGGGCSGGGGVGGCGGGGDGRCSGGGSGGCSGGRGGKGRQGWGL